MAVEVTRINPMSAEFKRNPATQRLAERPFRCHYEFRFATVAPSAIHSCRVDERRAEAMDRVPACGEPDTPREARQETDLAQRRSTAPPGRPRQDPRPQALERDRHALHTRHHSALASGTGSAKVG